MSQDEFTQAPRRRLSTGKAPWEKGESKEAFILIPKADGPPFRADSKLVERQAKETASLGDSKVRVSMRGVVQTAPYESFETVVSLECSAEVAQALDNGDATVTDAVQSAFAGAGGLVRDIVEAEMITTARKGAFYRRGGAG